MPSDITENRRRVLLDAGWQLARVLPGDCASPDQLDSVSLNWRDATVPGTVANSVHEDINLPGAYDSADWWYRLQFRAPQRSASARCDLCFDGLATLAEVWLNGTEILRSRNMFIGHRIDVSALLRDDNQMFIVFRSMDTELAQRRPRPRWKTALVEQQNLRWLRTTLLGRIPGWTPPIVPVGPWGDVALDTIEHVAVTALDLQTWAEGAVGRLKLSANVAAVAASPISAARLNLGNQRYELSIGAGHDIRIQADLTIPGVPLWWPHTHGTPNLLPCQLEFLADEQWVSIDCGKVGFKQMRLDQRDGNVEFSVNGVDIFCRGACWTTTDFLSLRGSQTELRRTLELMCDAGLNMLRIGGTMVYESNEFYQLCDELGILLWQDFMFANMDYPFADATFAADVEAEVNHQLQRLQCHACIAVYCGSSEVAQQAAMLGLPESEWSNDFFTSALPQHCAARHHGISYFPSTPWGGALPFHVASGISHYYGVGAYRRPISDVKSAKVKFTTECLGFSNVPDPETMALMLHGTTPPPHHPRWKARLPRDNGTGWDFEDIRDHYLKQLFSVDPVTLRSIDVARYYALSRVVTGEVMRRVFAEWRSPDSHCAGALVWFLRDLWPGAGWGIIDSTGRPKAAYWYLKRAWAAQSIHITDEGLDGLNIHVVNDLPLPLQARVELELLQGGRVATDTAQRNTKVPGYGSVTLQADAMLGYFSDSNAAYRFGPAKHDVICARLVDADSGGVLSEDFFFPAGYALPQQRTESLVAEASWRGDGKVALTLRSDAFLQAVSFSCKDFAPDDNHFHLAPQHEKSLLFSPVGSTVGKFRAHIDALNLAEMLTIRAESDVDSTQAQPAADRNQE